ncbi:MAG TPA: zinc ribbon domain-containing protein [Caulobacteraceae bacterium]|nr:zinc ribbon domain-containing protein [Caulobacteraceae bacterium]
MPEPLLKPALYREQGADRAPGHPALLGGQCEACGYVFFPLQSYGCERCGSTDLAPKALSGVGRLLASARVHLHAGKGREAPFTVVSIALDDGPIVRTLLVEDAGELRPGARMVTTLVPVADAEGASRRDLRFVEEA